MKQSTVNTAKLQIIASMLIFGTIGIFVRHVPLPSSVIALVRGVVGTLSLLILSRFRKTPVSREEIRKNILIMLKDQQYKGGRQYQPQGFAPVDVHPALLHGSHGACSFPHFRPISFMACFFR